MPRLSMASGALVSQLLILVFTVLMTTQPVLAQSQQQSLNQIIEVVYAATGYNSQSLLMTTNEVQFVVTLVNSNLAEKPSVERDFESNRVVGVIAREISGHAEFMNIQIIHVEYVERDQSNGYTRIIDSIDFRKDQQGYFRHYAS